MTTLEQVQNTIGLELPPITFEYDERDVSLYALGIGAPADWLDQSELQFVYELSTEGFKVLPSFAVIYISQMIETLISGKIGEIEYNPMMLVHGEQYLEILNPLPTSGTVICQPTVSQIYDKGSGIMVVSDVLCKDENGKDLAFTQSSMFIRGLGGYGGERGSSFKVEVPDREPDQVISETTSDKQALIYRLSGDRNPLHADPNMAAIGGFSTPILHGLCTFGYAVRAIIKAFGDNNPDKLKSVRVRFTNPVIPGETLRTEMWATEDSQIVFQTVVPGEDKIVLGNAIAELTA